MGQQHMLDVALQNSKEGVCKPSDEVQAAELEQGHLVEGGGKVLK